jgi:hypothetical protein
MIYIYIYIYEKYVKNRHSCFQLLSDLSYKQEWEKEVMKEPWRNIPAYEKFLPFFCIFTGAEEIGEKDPTVLQTIASGG